MIIRPAECSGAMPGWIWTLAVACVLAAALADVVGPAWGSHQCAGEPRAIEFRTGEQCFCLLTGGCLELCGGLELDACLAAKCRSPRFRGLTADTATFMSLNDYDILAIPVKYYMTISQLKARCPKGAEDLVVDLLESGRRAFKTIKRLDARYQCVHLPGQESVGWLHIHSFRDVQAMVSSGEMMDPEDTSPLARARQVCISADRDARLGAATMLRGADLCMAQVSDSPPPEFDFGHGSRCFEDDVQTRSIAVGSTCVPACPAGSVASPPLLNCTKADGDFAGVKALPFSCPVRNLAAYI